MKEDTIAGIATALSNSGISIIRISGQDSINIVNRIYKCSKYDNLNKSESNYLNYGFIVDEDDNIVDEVLVSVMRAPKSYTMENVVEINCHGGILVTKKILDMLISSGARIAEPGEFTKRAFLNGRIDLSQAESVMDLINADNEFSLKAGIKNLRGDIKNKIIKVRDELIYEIAFIESALDDPEHISLEGLQNRLSEEINGEIHLLDSLIASYDNGKIVKNGINTVIAGKPNAGKSSFLNMLMGHDRAIVTDIAGTTRDALEESVLIEGINLNIVDTAGVRDTDDVIEKIGVDKTLNYIDDADLVLYVVDSSVELDENDRKIISYLENKKVIVLYNKTDLKAITKEDDLRAVFDELLNVSNITIIPLSVKDNTGMEEFAKCIYDMFSLGKISSSNESMITSLRQKNNIEDALSSLKLVLDGINNSMPEDMLTIDMMNAYSSLGKVIGEEIDDDLVNEIFSKFCMGK